MERLIARGRRAGFFRPVVRAGEGADGLIRLMTARYALAAPYEVMYGVTGRRAAELVVADRMDELRSEVLRKYKELEGACEVVLCVGTDYSGVAAPLEFEFNAAVANDLGCLVLPVIQGSGRMPEEILAAVQVMLESLKTHRCDCLAIVVNRVAKKHLEDVQQVVAKAIDGAGPVYVLPDEPLLAKPTVGEVAEALGAESVNPHAEGMDREVADIKVAAMQLPHTLVITPRDRSDVALGTLMADASDTYPRVAGLLLTGDLPSVPQVRRLLDGLRASRMPVLSVRTDSFTTAIRVNAVQGAILPEHKRKIAAVLALVESHMDLEALEERAAVTRSERVTPLMFEYELLRRARDNRRHIVLPEGTDERILRATEILLLRGVVDITLLGDPEEVRRRASELGLSLDGAAIVDPLTSEWRDGFVTKYCELRKHKGVTEDAACDTIADVSYFGTMMVFEGKADGMVSGAAHTTQHTIRPAFEIIKTKPGCALVSSVFLMCLEDRVLVYGDCAVNPDPTAEQLAHIAVSSAETSRMFGIEPLVAMLSYSTGESGKGEDVERVREATAKARELSPDLKIEGPIQYDAAADAGVAKAKLPDSQVAGHATVFVFPDLNTGNNTYKAVQRTANAVAIGPVLQGLKKPVNDLSRGCTIPDIVNTVAITAIQAAGSQGQV
jgi:phosphate acetyltransferase